MRLDMRLPVAAFTLLTAALLQDQIPAVPAFPAKIVFLTAVALHAALTKPVWVALTVMAWAGGLTDALGGQPLLCTFSLLLALYGAVRLLQRAFLEATVPQGVLLVAAASVLQALWTRLWAGPDGALLAWRTVAVLAYAVPAGALAGAVGFALCGLADRVSGIVKPAKEGHGLLWAETNR